VGGHRPELLGGRRTILFIPPTYSSRLCRLCLWEEEGGGRKDCLLTHWAAVAAFLHGREHAVAIHWVLLCHDLLSWTFL